MENKAYFSKIVQPQLGADSLFAALWALFSWCWRGERQSPSGEKCVSCSEADGERAKSTFCICCLIIASGLR